MTNSNSLVGVGVGVGVFVVIVVALVLLGVWLRRRAADGGAFGAPARVVRSDFSVFFFLGTAPKPTASEPYAAVPYTEPIYGQTSLATHQ